MAHVNSQYARRDILVYDADLYEFVRKKISFKQTKNGFNIKNKKFNTKNDVVLEYEEEQSADESAVQQVSHAHLAENHPVVEPSQNIAPRPSPPVQPQTNIAAAVQQPKQRRVIKTVVFSPITIEARQKFPYKFTVNKTYPVFSEKPVMNGVGSLIETVDDLGEYVKVSDELFVSNDISLIGDNEVEFTPKNNSNFDSRLNWSGVVRDGSVPKLR